MLSSFFKRFPPTLLLGCLFIIGNTLNADRTCIDRPKGNVTLETALKHFKDCTKFPVVMDSTVTNHLNKFDSLGGPEVRILAQHWLKDSLIMNENHSAIMQEFYNIDSLKANHLYKKYCDSLQPGMTKFGNAYALEKLTLTNGAILLVWAFVTSSYEADPNSGRTCIYFTQFDNNTIGQTFLLAEELTFADPPSGSLFTCYSKLTADGQMVMKEAQESDDYDAMQAQVDFSHAIYSIAPGSIRCILSKYDSSATRPIKN